MLYHGLVSRAFVQSGSKSRTRDSSEHMKWSKAISKYCTF